MTGIKICGIKYDEDIGIINELKPDYAGMVLFFEKSKRNIAIDRAAEMIKKLDKNIQKTAVVVSPDINQIKAITDVGFDYIQIHKDMPDDILEKITIPVIRAVNMPDEINGAETESNFNDEIEKLIKNDKIYGILFDAGVPGSGKTFRWHRINGIKEKIRSQFVGTCLLALKNGLIYKNLSTTQIIAGVKENLSKLLNNNLNKARKLVLLDNNVLNSQDVTDLKNEQMQEILNTIKDNILPFINDESTQGQDLLNLFFTTFNKYVGKADKNQAFTPDHITQFMCHVVNVNKNSRVLDPCCGSGAFLVRAMTEAMDDCDTKKERDEIKASHIFGIEYEDVAFGLSTTNMLIHGDGNSNIIQGSMFEKEEWIADANIDIVLMNPPYNATRKQSQPEYVKNWNDKITSDPSKGLHYVYYIANLLKRGKLAVLLPMQCAIGASGDVKMFKEKMLEENTLDAVFSLPSDMFYPGANAVACCMIFNLGVRHDKAPIKETFFGYFKDDGFEKRKNLGRVEKEDGLWKKIEKNWLELYRKRKTEIGYSVTKQVTAEDEWLAEAYMDTDYSKLKEEDFQVVLNQYLGYLMSNGRME